MFGFLVQNTYLPFIGALTKMRKVAISLIMSVCPHGATRLPLD